MPVERSREGILDKLEEWRVSHILYREGGVEWLLAWDRKGRVEQGMQLFFAFKERYLTEIYADQQGFHVYVVPP